MRTLTWLHISDLHIREDQSHKENPVLRALLRDIAKQVGAEGLRPDLIAVSGDIAHSGRIPEYKRAMAFFDELLEATGLGKDRLFLVPGNHDVDRKLISRGAQATGNSLTDSKSVNEVLDSSGDRELMLARFRGYAWFVRDYLRQHLMFDDDNYYYVRSLDLVPPERAGSYQRQIAQALSAMAAALAKAGDMSTAAQGAGEALAAAERIWDQRDRVQMLTEMTQVLARAGDEATAGRAAQQALAAAQGIGDEHGQVEALIAATQALVQAGQVDELDRVLDVADRVRDQYSRALALCEVARALARVGDRETASVAAMAALASAYRVHGREKAEALSAVAQAWAEAENTEMAAKEARAALEAAEAIGDELERAKVLGSVTAALAAAGEVEGVQRALAIAGEIKDERDRARTLTEMAHALVEAGDEATAGRAAQQALAAAQGIGDGRGQLEALIAATQALAEAGQVDGLERAMDVADKVRDQYGRALALCEVAWALVRVGDRKTASVAAMAALASAYRVHGREKAQALSAVAQAWAEVENTEMAAKEARAALEAAEAIGDELERAKVLGSVTAALAAAGEVVGVQRALAIAGEIKDERDRARTLTEMAHALVEAGDEATAVRAAQQALEGAEAIRDQRERAEALTEMAEVLAEAGGADELERLLAVAERIEEDHERALALSGVAAALAQAGDVERATSVAEQALASRKRLTLLGLNSAWASGSPDDESRGLILGERQVRSALEQADGAAPDLTIALLHHPLDRLRPFDQQASAVLLNDGCDFLLHGHVHEGSSPLVQGPDARATVVGAGACYETPERPQTYNFVRLNFDTDEGQIHLRTYSDRQGGFWTRDVTAFPDAPDGVYTFPLDRGQEASEEMTVHESAPERVYVRELFLDNFRCFEKEDVTLSKGFTVLIGDNASGKSTLLEALKVGIGAFFLGIDGVGAPAIEGDQARRLPFRHGQTMTFEPQYPVRVACVGSWGEQEIKWAVVSKGRGLSIDPGEAGELADLARRIQSQVRRGGDVVLPLIAYYSTGRVWGVPEHGPDDSYGPGSRLQGYDRCLDQASHVGSMMEWIRSQEMIAQSKGESNEVYGAVKEALRKCVEGLIDIRFDPDERDLVADLGEGGELPSRLLSDGVRNMLAMVADIAHRAAILNPQFKSEAAKLTPGIVLIDELDLHLHPEWQRKVAADLTAAFPQMQFIATTHSPLIVGGLPHNQVFRLERGEVIETTKAESVQGWRADQILTSPAFGLESSRDPETEALIDTYSQLAVRDDLSGEEEEELESVAGKLELRVPSSAERQEAREAYEAIQDALLERWRARPAKEREELLAEVRAQLLESTSGVRRPS